jgi:hypothetical protein
MVFWITLLVLPGLGDGIVSDRTPFSVRGVMVCQSHREILTLGSDGKGLVGSQVLPPSMQFLPEVVPVSVTSMYCGQGTHKGALARIQGC